MAKHFKSDGLGFERSFFILQISMFTYRTKKSGKTKWKGYRYKADCPMSPYGIMPDLHIETKCT